MVNTSLVSTVMLNLFACFSSVVFLWFSRVFVKVFEVFEVLLMYCHCFLCVTSTTRQSLIDNDQHDLISYSVASHRLVNYRIVTALCLNVIIIIIDITKYYSI